MVQREDPATKKMADAIKWSQSASKDVDRYFSAGGFEAPSAGSFLQITCPSCDAQVAVIEKDRLKNPDCPYCGEKLWLISAKTLTKAVREHSDNARLEEIRNAARN